VLSVETLSTGRYSPVSPTGVARTVRAAESAAAAVAVTS
jgi:hypothetical protein